MKKITKSSAVFISLALVSPSLPMPALATIIVRAQAGVRVVPGNVTGLPVNAAAAGLNRMPLNPPAGSLDLHGSLFLPRTPMPGTAGILVLTAVPALAAPATPIDAAVEAATDFAPAAPITAAAAPLLAATKADMEILASAASVETAGAAARRKSLIRGLARAVAAKLSFGYIFDNAPIAAPDLLSAGVVDAAPGSENSRAEEVRRKFDARTVKRGKSILSLLDANPEVRYAVRFVVKDGADGRALIEDYALKGREGSLNDQASVQPNVELLTTRDEALKIAEDSRVAWVTVGDSGLGYGTIPAAADRVDPVYGPIKAISGVSMATPAAKTVAWKDRLSRLAGSIRPSYDVSMRDSLPESVVRMARVALADFLDAISAETTREALEAGMEAGWTVGFGLGIVPGAVGAAAAVLTAGLAGLVGLEAAIVIKVFVLLPAIYVGSLLGALGVGILGAPMGAVLGLLGHRLVDAWDGRAVFGARLNTSAKANRNSGFLDSNLANALSVMGVVALAAGAAISWIPAHVLGVALAAFVVGMVAAFIAGGLAEMIAEALKASEKTREAAVAWSVLAAMLAVVVPIIVLSFS